MPDVEHAELRCVRCGTQTEHEIAYAGRLLVAVRCLRCGELLARDVGRRPSPPHAPTPVENDGTGSTRSKLIP